MKINVLLCVKKNAISLFAQLLKWKAFQNGVYIKAGCIYKGDVASKYKRMCILCKDLSCQNSSFDKLR